MATDKAMQITSDGRVYTHAAFAPPYTLRRAYERRDYFPFPRAESVANYPAFVSPVAFFLRPSL